MNTKRNIIITISVFVFFVLQSTLFKKINFNGISPNLLLILCVSTGLMYGRTVGLVTGFVSGLLIDMFFGTTIGFYALLYMYIGFINGFFNRIFFKDDIKLPIALITASDFLYGIIIYTLLFLLRGKFHFSYYFVHIILPEIVYTVVIALFMYPILLFLHNRVHNTNKGSITID